MEENRIMPELPDPEAFSRSPDKKLAGKKLNRINVLKNAKANASKTTLKKAPENQELDSVYREGKGLCFAFSNKNIPGLHLMLRVCRF